MATSLLFGACGGGGGGGGGGLDGAGADEQPAETVEADVTIVNFAYEEPEFRTTAGTEVVWVNEGAAPHTVTGEAFDSRVIRSGDVFTHTFEEPGTYEYWCTNHEGAMSGTIIVE